ncbi:MAG: MEDS domain-containing protein, partial [Acidimicrobiia bacterium]
MSAAHVCVFHRGPAERDALLAGFFGAGVVAGEKCLCIADATDARIAEHDLRASLPAAPAAGQLSVLTTDAYLTDGRFLPERCVAQWDELLAGYVGEGFPAVRAAADVGWVLRAGVGRPALFDYESRCNGLGHHPATIHCLYDLDRFGPGLVAGLLARHTGAIAGGVLVTAPRPDAVLRPGSRPWAATEGSGQQFLALANLLLAGAGGAEEIADLVAQVCAAAVDVDLAAVAWPAAPGAWTARG